MLNKVNTLLFACLGLFACTTPAHAVSVDSYGLQYDSRDGTLTLTGINNGLAHYTIESDGVFLESTDFTENVNHNLVVSVAQLAPNQFLKVGRSASTPSVLSETLQNNQPNTPFNLIQGGIGNIGAVMPTGLSQLEFEAAINSALYVRGPVLPFESFNLVYVPEPASLGMLAISGLALLRRRRWA